MSNTYDVIPKDAVLPIEIGAGFYSRMQELTMYHCVMHTTDENRIEKLTEANRQIEEQDIKEEWIFHYETLASFCGEIERVAKLNGLVVQKPMEEQENDQI
jgi:hypothetical protein